MIVYLNGQYRPLPQATISVEDRGFMFADGVYEVVRYYAARPFAMAMHLERLARSAEAIRLPLPPDARRLDDISGELVRRNAQPDASVYWQITRGAAPRRHPFPSDEPRPTVLAIAYPADPIDAHKHVATLRAITRPDVRWHHCSIKSVALLPNVLDSQAAVDADAHEAILVRDGIVTEGTQRSIFIVTDDVLRTYPLDGRILDSITRRIVIELARDARIELNEYPCSADDLFAADEVIAVGSTTEIASIVQVDGRAIGVGQPGPIARLLFDRYLQRVRRECGPA